MAKRLIRGALVSFDIGGGKGMHYAIVLDADEENVTVVVGSTGGPPTGTKVTVDLNSERGRSLRPCLRHRTYFWTSRKFLRVVKKTALTTTNCTAGARLLADIELRF